MLGQWLPSSRDRFTCADFDFLTEVLAGDEHQGALRKLWEDPEALREMLDLKEVFLGLVGSPSALRVSPAFYFYVLVRHAFLEADLSDPDLADYVAGVLVQRVLPDPDRLCREGAGEMLHAADFLAIISSAQGRLRFQLQVAAGNQFLVLTGLYPGFLKRRSERRGAPNLEFYESFARQAYRGAADNPQAPGQGPRRLLGMLAEALPEARRSLNKVAEEFVFLGD